MPEYVVIGHVIVVEVALLVVSTGVVAIVDVRLVALYLVEVAM
jgi:hypothetical protein